MSLKFFGYLGEDVELSLTARAKQKYRNMYEDQKNWTHLHKVSPLRKINQVPSKSDSVINSQNICVQIH